MTAKAPKYIPRRFEVDAGALRADALARGITATLYILPHDEESRCIVLVNHQAATIMHEGLSLAVVQALFGTDECGEYDIVVNPKHRAPEGAPIN